MSVAQKVIIKMVKDISDDKALEVINFIQFIKSKEENNLYLSPEEDLEIQAIIDNDDWVSQNEVDELLGAAFSV